MDQIYTVCICTALVCMVLVCMVPDNVDQGSKILSNSVATEAPLFFCSTPSNS